MVQKETHLAAVIITRNMIKLREERGWSQDDLAEKYGCSFQYISQMETGHRGFGKTTFRKLMKAFGVTEKELLEMPKGLTSRDIGELWDKFSALETSENVDLFERILNLFNDPDPNALRALEGIVAILEKQKTPETK